MKKITNLIGLYLFIFVFVFTSCTKENLTERGNEYTTSQTITSNKAPLVECPEFEDILSPDFVLDDFFGENFSNNNWGLIDETAGCPTTALENCERACEGVTITFGYSGQSWLLSGAWETMPWVTGGVFTVAEQNTLLNDAINVATSQAPFCPNSNIQMEPVSYDFFHELLIPTSGSVWYVGVYVRYQAPCEGHEAIILDN